MLIFHIVDALAKCDRPHPRADECLRRHGTEAGTHRDRPTKLADTDSVALAQSLYEGGKTDIDTISKTMRTWRSTL